MIPGGCRRPEAFYRLCGRPPTAPRLPRCLLSRSSFGGLGVAAAKTAVPSYAAAGRDASHSPLRADPDKLAERAHGRRQAPRDPDLRSAWSRSTIPTMTLPETLLTTLTPEQTYDGCDTAPLSRFRDKRGWGMDNFRVRGFTATDAVIAADHREAGKRA